VLLLVIIIDGDDDDDGDVNNNARKQKQTKPQELNFSFTTPTNKPPIQPSIAPTCFGVTPSSGSSAPRFKTHYSMTDHKVIRTILQILEAGVNHVGFTNCD